MERRDFLLAASIFGASGLLGSAAMAGNGNTLEGENLSPVLIPGQPLLVAADGIKVQTRVRSAMTGGLFSSVETAVGPLSMGPPPHYHKELDELMYVIQGKASILIGDEVVQVTAGGWHLRPRMMQHTFWNAEAESLHFIDMYFNQPFEEYLEAVFDKLTPENGYPEGSEKKIQALSNLNEQFGLVFRDDAFSKMDEIKRTYGLH
jgi:mannose-6-phosphate isomerase-like protein (cupin superfamily)